MNCAIIMAAGKGSRMKVNKNKQFILIEGKPILAYTIEKFENSPLIDEIVVVAAEDEINFCMQEIVSKYGYTKVKNIVSGGTERQQSVLRGLKAAKKANIVLIHDGARPFVDNEIIEAGIKYADIYGGAACGVEPKDTIKLKSDNGFSEKTFDRSKLFCVQTPQCFKYDLILKAHLEAEKKEILATDDTMIFEMAGNKVYLYNGSYENIKITTPDDLYAAEILLNKK
ncbi:2-C-methyl-D-erythritol 4-phosphate cytidylyltransferase [Clostridium felsineum]|uniref:2-C-methyl-D-erythritol 4-phosphate cytidylyltransferase n=1 Tax=Clostridium felsineum TaxID=36839 RepID=UPI00098C86A9|nr:2-C-methyl-D-erythritol 4-phosphate cytidylyltransferase [Clostridium felsineum]URZ14714.1 2-C-methyl-D-erythritol 4-phosphate cytidylyltransferase [Clostridium felsineum DSM 794]